MPSLFLSAALVVALALMFSLYRVLRGPTAFDRLTGVGLLNTKTIVLIVLCGFVTERLALFVDIALSYALLSFIGTLALAKYFEHQERESL